MGEVNGKNILVFRSAKHPIVKECIQKVSTDFKSCTIWLCIQEQCADMYSDFANLELILFPNGMFSFERINADEKICALLTGRKFSAIYIPHSMEISNYREIEKIIRRIIGEKKVFYYNKQGEMKRKRIGVSSLSIKKIFKIISNFIEYYVIKVIYFYFTRRKQ